MFCTIRTLCITILIASVSATHCSNKNKSHASSSSISAADFERKETAAHWKTFCLTMKGKINAVAIASNKSCLFFGSEKEPVTLTRLTRPSTNSSTALDTSCTTYKIAASYSAHLLAASELNHSSGENHLTLHRYNTQSSTRVLSKPIRIPAASAIQALSFNDNTTVSCGFEDCTTSMYDITTKQPIRTMRVGTKPITALTSCKDNNTTCVVRDGEGLIIFDKRSDKVQLSIKPEDTISCVTTTPGGSSPLVVTGSSASSHFGTVKIWDVRATPKPIITHKTIAKISCIALSPDYSIFIGDKDGELRAIDSTGKHSCLLTHCFAPISDIKASLDGSTIAAVSNNKVLLYTTAASIQEKMLPREELHEQWFSFTRHKSDARTSDIIEKWENANGPSSNIVRYHANSSQADDTIDSWESDDENEQSSDIVRYHPNSSSSSSTTSRSTE